MFIQNEELFEERHFAELLAADCIRGTVALKVVFFTEVLWSVRKRRRRKRRINGHKTGNLPNKEVGERGFATTNMCL